MSGLGSSIRAGALAVAALVLAGPRLASQVPDPPRRLKTAATALPAIDLGLSPRGARLTAIGGHQAAVERAPERPWVAGRLLVKFRDQAHAETVAIDAGADPEATARLYAARADVEFAQPDYRAHYAFHPNDPLFAQQWNLSTLQMERAWDVQPGATSAIVVAVLDGGVAYDTATYTYNGFAVAVGSRRYPALGRVTIPFAAAPELAGPGRFVAPHDFIWGDDAPVDLDGHGTHVAGTIGQLTNNSTGVAGMAFNVKLMPVKVIDSFWDEYFESPYFGTDDTVALGIRYAADNGAKVLNMSIGREGPSAPVVRDALTYAVSKGAFVAVAGGNEFSEGNPIPRYAEPATQIDGVVSVGAVGRDRQRASYSSTGSWLELMAPGGDSLRNGTTGMILQQTYDFDFTDTFLNGAAGFHAPRFNVFEYIYYEGTSMATAHVAGLAALLYQQGITKPAAIEAALKRSASDLGTSGRDDQHGYGLINARAALRGLGIFR